MKDRSRFEANYESANMKKSPLKLIITVGLMMIFAVFLHTTINLSGRNNSLTKKSEKLERVLLITEEKLKICEKTVSELEDLNNVSSDDRKTWKTKYENRDDDLKECRKQKKLIDDDLKECREQKILINDALEESKIEISSLQKTKEELDNLDNQIKKYKNDAKSWEAKCKKLDSDLQNEKNYIVKLIETLEENNIEIPKKSYWD